MNWKCVLVGLVLVLPGTLLSVEGLSYNEQTRAVSESKFLDRLLKYLKLQGSHHEKYDSQRDEGNPTLQKKLDTNTNPAEIVQNSEIAATGDNSGSGNVKDRKATSIGGKSGGGQLNKAVDLAPRALRQSAEANSFGASGGEFAASNSAFVIVVAGCTLLAAVGIVGAGVCWYKYHKGAKAASVVEYPAYGVTGPTKDRIPSPGDRKLAHSAQMYHYQHQKQQMMAMQSASSGEMKHDASDDESVEDNDDADYTVYECPGLAPTGEMEVKNPLFRGDDTPSTPANDDSHPPPPDY